MPFDSPHCRVLLIDSSIEMLATLAYQFQPYGLKITATSTADDALNQAAIFQPHAVFMGLEYETCNGWQLIERLRKVDGMRTTIFVGLCDRRWGWQTTDGEGSFGFDYYLPKPPRMADVVSVLTTDVPEPLIIRPPPKKVGHR